MDLCVKADVKAVVNKKKKKIHGYVSTINPHLFPSMINEVINSGYTFLHVWYRYYSDVYTYYSLQSYK